MRRLPTGTVTFLFTDVEGSTRLLAEHGERYADLLEEHRRELRAAFERHSGVEVDTQGDAFFVAFARADDAVAAASDGQAALAGTPIRVRMGVHTGEPHVSAEGYVGMDVHRAARIAAAGYGDQVLVSERTRALLQRELELADLGLHRLKDLSEPVRLFQLGSVRFPPLRTLNATNLPTQVPLVGREHELAELGEVIPSERFVTLTGPGGTGKTRLALQAAAELVEHFSDGVFWVPLATVTDADLVLPAIASTLGAQVALEDHIDERRMLLLLDNLEQVLDAAPRLSELSRRCPNLNLLVTSRALLRVEGEHEYAVDPLEAVDAVALFQQRASVSEPEEAVLEICIRLDCLPLAVELAAARTSLLPPELLLERLSQRLPILTHGRRDAPARQATLRTTIGWSYDLLEPQEQQLFARLAVFAGSFDVEAAEEVAEGDLETLQSLAEKSLLRRWGSGRLGMLETIREFALERLEESGAAEELRRRHAGHYLVLAESANLAADAAGPARNDIALAEQSNMRAALDWLADTGQAELGLQLTVALENFWVTASPDEGELRVRALLALGSDVPPRLRARALRAWGGMANIQRRFDDAVPPYQESLDIYRELGDSHGIAIILHRFAQLATLERDLERARSLCEQSMELHRRSGYRRGEAQVLRALGDIEQAEGHNEAALELMRESASIAEQIGFVWWQAGSLRQAAELAVELGRFADAEAWAREALTVARRIRDRRETANGVALLARVAFETDRHERAGRLWGAVEAEEARAPLGGWETMREEYANVVLERADERFEQGRAAGRALSLDEAVEYAFAA
jgi:predicted ATPase/class 3 adenylate cyclase